MSMSGRWDQTKVLKFIRLYQENECLWNTKSVFYKNKTARDNAYRRMLQGMNDETMNKTNLQNKIRTLRNTYLHEYKKVNESNKLGIPSRVYIPKLSWYDEMDFLASYIEERDAVSPEHVMPVSPSITIDSDVQRDPLQSVEGYCSEAYIKNEFVEIEDDAEEENTLQQRNEIDNDDMSNSSDLAYLNSIIESPPSKKRKSELNIVNFAKNPRKILHKMNSDVDGDEFYYFGLSIAAQLKNMPLENALQMQAKMQNLLTNERREILQNPTSDHNYTQQFDSESVNDSSSAENKGRFGVPVIYKNAGNDSKNYITEPITSTIQKPKKMSIADSNPSKQILHTLHTITENQLRMQEQLNIVQSFCDRSREQVHEKILRQNLVISKESLKTLKKLFGEGLSQMEEEMGSFFPLSSFSEIEELENKIKIKENEDALKTYLVSKKGNQNVDNLFRNLITDELLDAFNWDGRSGKKALKSIRLFNVVLNDIYCHMSRKDYETEVRKFVELSHNRAKQKRIKQHYSKELL